MDILKNFLKAVLSLLVSVLLAVSLIMLCVCAFADFGFAAVMILAAVSAATAAALLLLWKQKFRWCFWLGSVLLICSFIFIALRRSMLIALTQSEEFKALETSVTRINTGLIIAGVVGLVLSAGMLIYGSVMVSRLNKAEGVQTVSILNKFKKNKWR